MARKKKRHAVVFEKGEFNGLTVYEPPAGIVVFKNYGNFVDAFSSDFYRCGHTVYTYSSDVINILGKGYVSLGAESDYRIMCRSALMQLLGILRIPLAYARRISHKLLIDSMNAILKQNGGRQINIQTGPNNSIIGFWLSNNNVTTYKLFTRVHDELYTHIYHFAIVEGSRAVMLLESRATANKDVGAGVEIACCDTNSIKPTISGYIFNKRGHAMIRRLSYKLVSDRGPAGVYSLALSYANSIEKELRPYIDAFKNMDAVKLDSGGVRRLHESSSKALRKPLSMEDGASLKDAYLGLEPLRKNAKTLKEKREIATFAGSLLEESLSNLVLETV